MDITDFIETAKQLGVLGVLVTQDGDTVARWHSEPDCRRNLYSVAKSFTSCAVGFALQEGRISLEERLVDAFAGDLPPVVGPMLEKAVVRDLLTMCLGQAEPGLLGHQRPRFREDDWVKMSLAQPFVDAPGTRFLYNNVGPYLAGVLVQRRCGCDLVSYLTPRLLSPLEIRCPMWETDRMGYTFGASGLFLTLSELHRFGLFYLHQGRWDGEQLLSSLWVRESTRQQSDAPYGYLFWMGEYGSYRADGKYGQLSIVLPEREAVVSVVAECRRSDELKAAVYSQICARL